MERAAEAGGVSRRDHPAAAASLHEGLEETLTLQKLGLPGGLWRSLRSTNPIESCLSRMSDLSRNVRRRRNANMAWRWAGTMLLEAEKRFRRIVGHRELPILVAALEKSVAVKKQSA
jgi:putative transposase